MKRYVFKGRFISILSEIEKKKKRNVEKVQSTVVYRLDMLVIFAVIYVCKKYGMNFLS